MCNEKDIPWARAAGITSILVTGFVSHRHPLTSAADALALTVVHSATTGRSAGAPGFPLVPAGAHTFCALLRFIEKIEFAFSAQAFS